MTSEKARMAALVAVVIAAASLVVAASLAGCAPKTMPADWPIPQLTLPPGAKIVKVHRDLVFKGTWIVKFDCGMSGSDAVKHVEQQLAPLGYLKFRKISEDVPMEAYYSSDGLVEVTLHDMRPVWALSPGMKMPYKSDFTLDIRLHDSPHPGLRLSEPLP